MKNIEKYYEDLVAVGKDGDIAFDKKYNKIAWCADIDCRDCLFHGNCNNSSFIKWLNEEYIEPEVDCYKCGKKLDWGNTDE